MLVVLDFGAKIQETSETDVSLVGKNVSYLGILLFLLGYLPILTAGHAVNIIYYCLQFGYKDNSNCLDEDRAAVFRKLCTDRLVPMILGDHRDVAFEVADGAYYLIRFSVVVTDDSIPYFKIPALCQHRH